jgi:hypothetical protein
MAEVALAQKFVDEQLVDTWSKGAVIPSFFVPKLVARGGDSVDIGSDETGPSIHEDTEIADPEDRNFDRTQLIVNEKVFLNSNISPTQMAQLLGGNFADELVRADGGAFKNKIDDKAVSGLLRNVPLSRHANVACAALSKPMLSRLEAKMGSLPGVTKADLLWLVSPAAAASMSDLFSDVQPATIADSADRGKISGRSFNGIPAVEHMAIPGYNRRRQIIIAAAITGGDTLTLTMSTANHGFVVGQRVLTSGLQVEAQDVEASPVIASVSGATITIVDAAHSDDADNLSAASTADDPTAFLYSNDAQAILIARPRVYYGSDQVIPLSSITKRTDNAGWSHQLFQHVGFQVKTGAARVLHAELVEAEDTLT